MKHTIVYNNKNEYASFPLLNKLEDRILIGFFTAPIPDHMGIFNWNIMQSFNQGETWEYCPRDHPATLPRETSDSFGYELNGNTMTTGSYGFVRNVKIIHKSKGLFVKSWDKNWKMTPQKLHIIQTADIVLTFPRPLISKKSYNDYKSRIRLIPAYAVLKDGTNRAFAWRSDNVGKTWRLYNMFPSEVNVNEMAFIWTNNGILAHLRSDQHPYIMESWSEDGKLWTYPTNIFVKNKELGENVIGGPPHLLRLNDNRILCTYGYRLDKMGIRAIVSEDEGNTWSKPIILR